MERSRQQGFTLVELMIVVAIIGILASIAIPNYQKYQAKARTSEGKIQLASAYTTQKSYWVEFGSFTGCLGAAGYSPDIGSVAAPSVRYYVIGIGATAVGSTACGPGGGLACNGTSWGNGAPTCVAAGTDGTTAGDPPGVSNGTYYTANKSASLGGSKAGLSALPTQANTAANWTMNAFTIGAAANIDTKQTNTVYDQWTITEGKVIQQVNVGY